MKGLNTITSKANSQIEFDEGFLRKLENLHLLSKKAQNGKFLNARRTKRSGAGIEFREHREYVTGDDFRSIDWNAYGRLDKLLCRLFEKEENLKITFGIDASTSMLAGVPSKFFTACKTVAALAYMGLANHELVSVSLFSEEHVRELPLFRGKNNVHTLLKFLSSATCGGQTDLSTSIKRIAHGQKKPGVFVYLSDFYDHDGFKKSLDHLLWNKHEPFVIQLYAENPIPPSLKGDLTLVDSETNQTTNITMTPKLLKRFHDEHRLYSDELSRTCTGRAVPYLKVASHIDIETLILKVLRTGQVII